MRRPLVLAAVAAAILAIGPIGIFACSERQQPVAREALKTFSVAREMPPSAPDMPVAPPPPQAVEPRSETPAAASPNPLLPETVPRIAYTYGFRFRLPAGAVAALQERHLTLCQRLGEARCRIVSMGRGERRDEDEAVSAALELEVAASLAARFGQQLAASAGEAGADPVERNIAAEDLSRPKVDSEARIRTRETLIRRLSALLETRSGNIQQAVEAERAINQAQEELDAARNWLGEMRGRVATSRFRIAYDSDEPAAPRRNPLAASFDQIGALTVQSLAVIVLVAGVALPWAAAGLAFLALARWQRRRRERSDAGPLTAPEPAPA